MKLFEYKCPDCLTHYDTADGPHDRIEGWCPHCVAWKTMVRVFSFSNKPMMHAHYNTALGDVTSDPKRFAMELRAKGERQTEQDGIERRLVPIDMGDTEALGVTGEGIYESNVIRSRRNEPLLPMPKGS